MNCKETLHLLDAWIDGELPADKAREVSMHIGECDTCANEAESLGWIVTALSELPSRPMPPDLAKRTMWAFKAERGGLGLWVWWKGLGFGLRTAVLGLAACGFLCGVLLSNAGTGPDLSSARQVSDVYLEIIETGIGEPL
jgi:anti-sigma factor RsiW